jgi:hypothetical protein
MALTHQQIETLFEFTRKKLVSYYDVQVELVDHLASSIEEEMTQDTTISFESALEKVYARFGIFGFAHVVQERQIALEKQHRKLWQQTFKNYFTIPRVAFTVVLFCSILYITQLLKNNLQTDIIYALVYGCFIVVMIRLIIDKRKTRKPLLLTQSTPSFYILLEYVLPVCLGIFESNVSRSPLLLAGIITCIIIVQIALFKTHRQIQMKAMQLYPDAFART